MRSVRQEDLGKHNSKPVFSSLHLVHSNSKVDLGNRSGPIKHPLQHLVLQSPLLHFRQQQQVHLANLRQMHLGRQQQMHLEQLHPYLGNSQLSNQRLVSRLVAPHSVLQHLQLVAHLVVMHLGDKQQLIRSIRQQRLGHSAQRLLPQVHLDNPHSVSNHSNHNKEHLVWPLRLVEDLVKRQELDLEPSDRIKQEELEIHHIDQLRYVMITMNFTNIVTDTNSLFST